jgi:uncharacterized protein YqgC (DUF456 family)
VLAWSAALAGLVLGGLAAIVPGFPGCAIALLGLVAFAGLTDFAVVGPSSLGLALLVVLLASVAQLAAPITGNRALDGSAGTATGAALGAAFGALIPLPGASWACAVGGAAALGIATLRGGVRPALRGVAGTAGGCLVGTSIDFAATVAVGAILAVADFRASLGA